MSGTTFPAESQPLVLHLGSLLQRMSDHEFFEFCQLNEPWRFERTRNGDLIIMSPTGRETGRRNFILSVQFGKWVENDGTGVGFDSSTGFTLPNGAKRSPDMAWIRRSRWDALSDEQKQEFPPLCPDFVVEMRSRSDRLDDLHLKMAEYVENGAGLGLLVDPEEKKVYVYRPGQVVVCWDDPEKVSAEPFLPGCVLDIRRLWQ